MLVTEWDIDAFTDTNGPSTLEYSFAIGMNLQSLELDTLL
mgnify:CR=1 FL=1